MLTMSHNVWSSSSLDHCIFSIWLITHNHTEVLSTCILIVDKYIHCTSTQTHVNHTISMTSMIVKPYICQTSSLYVDVLYEDVSGCDELMHESRWSIIEYNMLYQYIYMYAHWDVKNISRHHWHESQYCCFEWQHYETSNNQLCIHQYECRVCQCIIVCIQCVVVYLYNQMLSLIDTTLLFR